MSQIPVKSSETPVSNKGLLDPNHVFALTRRLEARIRALEVETSVMRRDLNATRKKVYRDEDKALPSIDHPNQDPTYYDPVPEIRRQLGG